MITEADHQGGRVMYPTALPAFVEGNHNLHVAMKPTRIHVQESENKLLLLLIHKYKNAPCIRQIPRHTMIQMFDHQLRFKIICWWQVLSNSRLDFR